MPTSDFESFVRDRLSAIGRDTSTVAGEVLRLGANDRRQDSEIENHRRDLIAHDVRIDRHDATLLDHAARIDDHHKRLEDLGKPSTRTGSASIPPLERLGKPSATGSHFTVEVDEYVRALSPLAAQIDALGETVRVLEEDKRAALKTATAVEKARNEDKDRSDRTIRRLTFGLGLAVALCALFAFLQPRLGAPAATVNVGATQAK